MSLTELMAGVKAPTKVVQLFQLTCFPLGHKVSRIAIELKRRNKFNSYVCVLGPDIDQFAGGTDEYGGAMASKK